MIGWMILLVLFLIFIFEGYDTSMGIFYNFADWFSLMIEEGAIRGNNP